MKRTPLERYQFRKDRVRQKVTGTSDRPRLSIYCSLKHIYAQVVDDGQGKTLTAASSLDKALRSKKASGSNVKAAEQVGKLIAEKSLKLNIKKVVFDRGGKLYHGCVKAVADSARSGGLEF